MLKDASIFSNLVIRIDECYETDRRKTQEKSEILADQLFAGQRARALAHGVVQHPHPCVRLVGEHHSLIAAGGGSEEGDFAAPG